MCRFGQRCRDVHALHHPPFFPPPAMWLGGEGAHLGVALQPRSEAGAPAGREMLAPPPPLSPLQQ
jgi:hypothetical protein